MNLMTKLSHKVYRNDLQGLFSGN